MAFGQGNGGFTAEALALIARMSPTPNYTRKVVINQLVADLIAGNVWNDLDVLHVYAADASGNALLNFKGSSYSATNSGATFTADRGFTGNASSAYLNPGGYGPGSGQFAQNDHAYGVWARVEGTTGSYMGCNSGAATYSQVDLGQGIDGAGSDLVLYGANDGFLANSRTSSSEWTAYRNGVAVGTKTTSSYTVPSNQLRVLCARNSVGSEVFFSDVQVSAFFAGKGLDATKMAALYTALARYMTSVGA